MSIKLAFLAWAWLAKAKGHSCHTKKSTLAKIFTKLENVFVKYYAPNLMPDPKGEWSLKENISELHYGICSKVYQFIYTLANYKDPSQRGSSDIWFKRLFLYKMPVSKKKESNATGNLRNRFKS